MNLTSLAGKLLNDGERTVSDKGFIDSYESFKAFFKTLPSFAVYFDKANNYANTANTAYLTRRIVDETGFTGEVCLVYDKTDTKLCEKIKQNLPFLEKYSYAESGDKITAPFVLCGGSEQADKFWGTLSQNVRYVMTIRPYLDGADFSFIKIRNEKNEWITFFTDTISMNQPFPMRNFYIDVDKIKKIPDDTKKYWNGLYKNLGKADDILKSANVSIFPVSGLAAENPASDRGDNCVLILALAALAKLKSDGQALVLVFTDYGETNDPHFSLLKSFCDVKKDSVAFLQDLKIKYPQAVEEDLKAGLLNPLLQKRSELASVLDKVEFCGDINFKPGKLHICPIGGLPYDYIAALYAKSSFLFFESCDYTNLAVNPGVPFLQKSIETYSAYPDFFSPSDAAVMDDICAIFGNDISVYSSAFNKNLSKEIDKISNFLLNPKTEYFSALSLYAQGKSDAKSKTGILNDKLAASASTFYMLKKEMEGNPQKHVLFRNDNAVNSTFEELYNNLHNSFKEETKTLNISKALDGMRISEYFTSLAGGGDFILTLDSPESIVLDRYETEDENEPGEVCGVSIINAKSAEFEDGTFEIKFTDWHGGDSYSIYINGNFNQANNLLNIPWLKFSDVNFSVITAENNMPTKGSVGGTFGKTSDYPGVNFVIDLNYQKDITRIMAVFHKPLLAFDAFGAIAGGIDFNAQIPTELLKVVELGLSELVFYYDKKNNKITSMNFSFANSSGNQWELWEKDGKALLTAQPGISVTVNSPMDLAKRQIEVSVGAFVDIGDKNEIMNGGEIGQLYLAASYPPFIAEMRMASEKINIGRLLNLFGCDADIKADITDLSVFADFGNKNYKFSAAVGSDWKITDNFTITGLGLHIADKAGKFSIGFAGTMRILDMLDIGVAIGYNAGAWKLMAKAKLNGEVSMSKLVETYKGKSNQIILSENKDNPLIAGLDFSLTKSASNVDFEISASVDNWEISVFKDKTTVSASGAVGMKNGVFYGHLQASVNLLGADFIIRLVYGTESKFEIEWGKFKGYITGSDASINLKDFNIGEMIETITGWLCGSKFTLDPPWDILNNFQFNLKLNYNFDNKEFKVAVELPSKPNLGFGELQSINVTYNPSKEKKIDVNLAIIYAWGTEEKLSWDVSKPGTAPAPAGRGNKYFDLRYLALGQKVEFFKNGFNPQTTDEAIAYLIDNTKPETFPPFKENSGMLVATDFGILKSGDSYFLDAALVFYDPALFALRIKLAGAAAKIFDGFSFEIIYAKLSETLGVFKSAIILPNKFRQFDLGAYSVTLPDFYIEIYTNGDFKIDIGFPKNGDFSRSFSLSGIVPPGIPLTGSAGFYFGKLSSATAESSGIYLPKSNKGMFNPAIIFGIGLRIGIGKSINYGILSGGFSLTVTAILEGVIAKWNAYDNKNPDEEWYYKLKGTAALIGEIYGKVDFILISASVKIKIGVSVDFIYETCRKMILTLNAFVEASASLTINLWLFKITIGFSFKVQVKESFTIGNDTEAPWDKIKANDALSFAYPKATAAAMDFSNLTNPTGIKTEIGGNLSLTLTAAEDEYSGKEKRVIGNVILTVKNGESKDFESFAEILVYWVIAAASGHKTTVAELSKCNISDEYLAGIEAFLENESMPVSIDSAEAFLDNFFNINILSIEEEYENLFKDNKNDGKNNISGTYFPIPPNTRFKSSETGKVQYEYALKDYNSISGHALIVFKEIFKKLAVVVEEEETAVKSFADNKNMSVSELVFCDWFSIAASHAVRSMRKSLRDMGGGSCTLEKITGRLKEDNFYGDLSGMLSRFFLHGLRLPTVYKDEKLIEPLEKGLWVSELPDKKLTLPKEAGIFSLTGQAFDLTCGENISFKVKVESDNGYFNLPKDFFLEIDSGRNPEMAKMVSVIAECAKSFTLKCDFEEVKADFAPEIISFANPAEINERYIWTIPESLSCYFNREYLAYPEFGLYLTKYDGEIQKRGINCSPLALIEFSISETDTKGVYIIGSASRYATQILRNIITSDTKIETIDLLNAKLFENGVNSETEPFFAISQINMSTETRPPDNTAYIPFIDTLKLLWKALVTNNGGYILTYRDSTGTKLGDKVTLAVQFGFEFEKAGKYLRLINAVSSDKKPEENEVLTAFAEEYDFTVTVNSENSSIPIIEIAEKYCTDIRGIAEKNPKVILNPVEWEFKNIVIQSGGEPTVKSFTSIPKSSETLADFAGRNFTSPAYALWLNCFKTGLFAEKQKITIPVQAGCRMPSGSENTCSKINESYIVKREKLPEIPSEISDKYAQSVLQNNYSLLCYGIKGESETSAPYSYKKINDSDDGSIVYDITVPTDKFVGGEYKSVGKLTQNSFNWLDYYGNKLVPEFYSARLAGYQDAVLGLSKWQSIVACWEFKDASHVSVTLSFSKDDYVAESAGEYARKCALAFYMRLRSQINDDNLEIRLECSVFNKMSDKLPKKVLIERINQIIDFLESGRGGDIGELTLDFSFEKNDIPFALTPLECYFVMIRNGCADKGYEEVADVITTKSAICFPKDLRGFAGKLREVFGENCMVLKSGGASDLYVYKKSSVPVSIDYNKPEIFLPCPVSNVLTDCDGVPVKIYADRKFSKTENKNYRAVDLNIWFRNTLKFADDVMSADIVSAAVLSGCDGDYDSLLDVKKAIAGKLAETLSLAFKNSSKTAASEEAKELFRQRMLGSLSSFYRVKAIAILPAEVDGLPENAVFFGNLTDLNNNPLSFSSPKLKNGKNKMVFAVSGADVVLDTDGAVMPKTDLKLIFNATHIESGITPVIDDFNASEWYGKIDLDIANVQLYNKEKPEPISIPLPLYDFPETPIMVSQDSEDAEDVYSWRYSFTYSRSYNYPQQICNCTVKYNTQKIPMNTDSNDSLFVILAQISESGAAIYEDLRECAAGINQSSDILPDDEKKKKFGEIFNCAKEILLPLKEAQFHNADSVKFVYNANAMEEIKFSVTECKYKENQFCIALKHEGAAAIEIEGIEPQIENYTSEYLKDEKAWIFRDNNDDYLSVADGQKINKRKIVMQSKKVLQYQNAVSEIYVRQNERLCGDKDMDDIFVYTTPTAAFDSALNAFRIVEEADLAADKHKKPLSEALIKYLEDLCGDNTVIFQARGIYSTAGFNEIAPVVYPVFSQTRKQIVKGGFAEVVDGWINVLTEWRKNFPIDIKDCFTEKETLSFEFIFFSAVNATPLLTVKNAYISGEYITLN